MLQNVTSPTYSINENAIKLNNSSVALSSPEYSISSDMKKHALVQFEQFDEGTEKVKVFHGKKRLTIEIDSSYDFQNNEDSFKQSHIVPLKNQYVERPSLRDNRNPQEMMKKVKDLEQKLEKQKISLQELERYAVRVQIESSQFKKENEALKQLLRKKQDIIQNQQQKNDELIYTLAHYQQKQAQDNFYDEKLRDKEAKIKEQQKLYQKIVIMNKTLQKQLHDSDRKIMELQKQLHKSVCVAQYQNLAKIKESSCKLKEYTMKVTNKENNMLINAMKSLDKKKTTSSSQIKKIGRVVSSSSSNLTKKLHLNK